jgi:hypothetical protein
LAATASFSSAKTLPQAARIEAAAVAMKQLARLRVRIAEIRMGGLRAA